MICVFTISWCQSLLVTQLTKHLAQSMTLSPMYVSELHVSFFSLAELKKIKINFQRPKRYRTFKANLGSFWVQHIIWLCDTHMHQREELLIFRRSRLPLLVRTFAALTTQSLPSIKMVTMPSFQWFLLLVLSWMGTTSPMLGCYVCSTPVHSPLWRS